MAHGAEAGQHDPRARLTPLHEPRLGEARGRDGGKTSSLHHGRCEVSAGAGNEELLATRGEGLHSGLHDGVGQPEGFGDVCSCGLLAAGLLMERGVLVPELLVLLYLLDEPLFEGSHRAFQSQAGQGTYLRYVHGDDLNPAGCASPQSFFIVGGCDHRPMPHCCCRLLKTIF